RERPRQILLDEPLRAAQALQAELDEDAGRILDVLAGRLHETRDLTQLGQDATGPLGQRRVVEECLASQARGYEVAVMLRAPLPGADGLKLEQTGADRGVERRALEALNVGQPGRIDGAQPSGEPAEGPDLVVDGAAA